MIATESKVFTGCLGFAIAFTLMSCQGMNHSSTPPTNPSTVSVTLNQSSASIAVGTSTQFTATVQNTTNTAVTWSVNAIAGGNTTVGTVSATGLYTAPAQSGSFTVTATSVAAPTASAQATVTVGMLGALTPASAVLAPAATQQFTASVQGFSNTTVNWSVDQVAGGNSTVGTISATGLYTAPSQTGTHTVTAASAADPSLTANATVSVFVFTISPTSLTLAPSATEQFTTSIQGLTNTTVSWSVDGVAGGNATTGTITATGLYTAPDAIGAHTVTATSTADPNFSVSAALTVVNIAQAAVLTYHNDDARDGAYLEEVTLTPANVNSTQFGKLLAYPVDGQIYAQPLYMPNLSIAGGTHDVAFVATQNNSVYAFDADATSQNAQTFWHVGPQTLGPSVVKNDPYGVNPNVGILSTPVIDATTSTMYLVVETSNTGPNGTPFFLHALDVTTGADKFGGPVAINGSVPGTGDESVNGTVSLGTDCYQRMALALNPVKNAIEIAFGSCAHGWVLSYDKTSLQQTAIFNTTPDWQGGGLWASDGAPAIDDTTGDVYVMTGSDTGDQNSGNKDLSMLYNNSFLQLAPTNLSVTSYFTPDDTYNLALQDVDLGSGSNILVPGNATVSVTLGGGKDGNVFVLNRNNMGGFNAGSNNVLQEVQICANGQDNIFSTPAYWNGNIYYHCDGYGIAAYSWNANTTQMSSTPTSKGSAVFQTHGATPSVSANGAMNGIIWEIDNSAYTTVPTGPSVLHAYDSTNVANELYSSATNSSDTAGLALKFTVPTIANGRVFVPTTNELDIYGLLP